VGEFWWRDLAELFRLVLASWRPLFAPVSVRSLALVQVGEFVGVVGRTPEPEDVLGCLERAIWRTASKFVEPLGPNGGCLNGPSEREKRNRPQGLELCIILQIQCPSLAASRFTSLFHAPKQHEEEQQLRSSCRCSHTVRL